MDHSRIDRQTVLLAAVHRFPGCEFAIRRLFEKDEPFRDICEELAEAERALAKAGELPAVTRDARIAEWQGIVNRLAGELQLILEGVDAVLISRATNNQPR